jgi:hypothetical protein
VCVLNPTMYSHSLTLGSTQQKYIGSSKSCQDYLHEKVNLKNLWSWVRLPVLAHLAIDNGNMWPITMPHHLWHVFWIQNVTIMRPSSCDTKSYAYCNKLGGATLVHNHHNQWAQDPLMQHPPKLVCLTKHGLCGCESLNKRTFSKR